jgi:sugar fermentation stimulation protein A
MHNAPDSGRIHLPFPAPLREARFVARPNRFLLHCALESCPPAEPLLPGLIREVREPSPSRSPSLTGPAERRGGVVEVHLADPGRLKELLLPGQRVWIRAAGTPTRRTAWSAVLVEAPDGAGLVSVDTTMPNRLIHRALEAEALAELAGWRLERAEWPHGRSRIDFLLARDDRQLALEVKSVTLVEEGVALFPDAITARGARHVHELTELVRRDGWAAAILFVLQRDDAHRIEAARSIDPKFADALAEARAAGVRILGRRCQVSLEGLTLGSPVPAG